jgi:hypothetical protein
MEKIMQENIPHRKYCVQDYGCQKFTEMQMSIASDVIYVKGLEKKTRRDEIPLKPQVTL